MGSKCVFCADGIGSTADHVPPRSFFPEKLPHGTNLITVPCCTACHKASQVDDGTVRNLLISLEDTESLPIVKTHLLPKRDRAFLRTGAEIKRLIELTSTKEVVTTGGIYLG